MRIALAVILAALILAGCAPDRAVDIVPQIVGDVVPGHGE
jgi:outer membrane murein-binding lipoprotein Lpp